MIKESHVVSIHLMLLFIAKRRSCYSCDLLVSIHLMLLFIPARIAVIGSPISVSIHLMLLFIGYKIGNYCFFRLFQYISCYSLSQFLHTFEQINWKFQYISCYSLSWILSYEGRKVLGFNTSHVTLYRLDENESYWSLVFQYISCYSLSVVEIQKLFKLKGFQYISCYSLSLWINTESALQIRFNTSHVTLYLWQNGLIT